MTDEQERKLDQLTAFVVALSGELSDLTGLVRNYIHGQADHERRLNEQDRRISDQDMRIASQDRRIYELEHARTTPCPPPVPEGEAA